MEEQNENNKESFIIHNELDHNKEEGKEYIFDNNNRNKEKEKIKHKDNNIIIHNNNIHQNQISELEEMNNNRKYSCINSDERELNKSEYKNRINLIKDIDSIENKTNNNPIISLYRNKIIKNKKSNNNQVQTQIKSKKEVNIDKNKNKNIIKIKHDEDETVDKKIKLSLTPNKKQISHLISSNFSDTVRPLEKSNININNSKINNDNEKKIKINIFKNLKNILISPNNTERALDTNDNNIIYEDTKNSNEDIKINNGRADVIFSSNLQLMPMEVKKKNYKSIELDDEESNIDGEIKININVDKIKQLKQNRLNNFISETINQNDTQNENLNHEE